MVTPLPTVTPIPPSPTLPPLEPTVILPTTIPAPPTVIPEPTAIPWPSYDLVLVGATIFTATGIPPIVDGVVAIDDGRIAAVGPRGTVLYDPNGPTYDLQGATLMPGLVNAHVHVSELSDAELQAWVRAGVTTLRDLQAPLSFLERRNELVVREDPTFPRLVIAGPMVTVAGGHPIPVYGFDDKVQVVHGPHDARDQASALIDLGVDLVKVVVSGRTDVRWNELSNAEIAAIAGEAQRRGVRVTAHVDRAVALRRAVENGISDAAHSPRDRVPDETFRLMVEHGVGLVPTIAVYEALAESRGQGHDWRRYIEPVMHDNLRRFAAAGGLLALGDDYGGVPGMPIGMPMDEINHWLRAGLSLEQILTAATYGGAVVSGVDHEVGTVELGKRADLLIIAGNPFSDLSALNRPLLVLRDGVVVFSQ